MSEVITFYSYKGGVGRTMALANISILLAKWGHKVLVVDWDLEAPGLEHFYKDYININVTETKTGVIDLLQLSGNTQWQDCLIPIKVGGFECPIHLISSGKRDAEYFNKVRSFDVHTYYKDGGGDIIEQWRNEWLENYDYVLIDSRTGITEIGGICTIQLPDTVVMLFTATDQGFEGVLDIIKRAGAAQQKLSYDRKKLLFLPIPAKFETNAEFKLSQDWLNKFSTNLESTYNDWLPVSINRKNFLELTKIPYVPYFSFGEKLPVIEQGVKDPSGLGYAYESIAALLAHHLNNVDWLDNNRDEYIAGVNNYYIAETDSKKNGNGHDFESKLKQIKQNLNIDDESVKIEKSKEVILECITNSISPLLNILSLQIKKIGSIFNNINETLTINRDLNPAEKIKYHSDLINLNYFSFLLDSYIFNSLVYSCNFTHPRSTLSNDFQLPFSLFIIFHEKNYEVISIQPRVSIYKLYHEIITEEEIETLVAAISAMLLQKIEAAMRG